MASGRKAARTRVWRFKLGLIHAMNGQRAEALAIARQLEADPTPIDAWGLAEIHGVLGNTDECLRWLRRAEQERWSWIPWTHISPSFRSLHGDPWFEEITRRVGNPIRYQTTGGATKASVSR